MLRRSTHLLKLRSPHEPSIIDYILWEGRDLRWTLYGRHNVAEEFGLYLKVHPDVAKRCLRRLANRGWLRRGKDSEGRPYLQLTAEYAKAAVLADQRMKVRRALGSVTWQKINGNDAVADALHEMTLTRTETRYKARVNAAAGEIIFNARSLTQEEHEVSPRRRQSVPSQGALRLLAGGRTSRANGA